MTPDDYRQETAAGADWAADTVSALGATAAGAFAVALAGYVLIFHGEALADFVNRAVAGRVGVRGRRVPVPVAVLLAGATVPVGVVLAGMVPATGNPPRFWAMTPAAVQSWFAGETPKKGRKRRRRKGSG
jgi:hypothetical protein